MARYKVLCTKKIDPALVKEAEENNIELIEREFISVTPIVSQEKYEEVLKWIEHEKANVVITSSNAAMALCYYLKFDDFYEVSEWNFFCMSGKTKETLEDYSKDFKIAATARSSAALAEKIIEKKIKEVVFFCGDKRREELPEILSAKGIKVNEVVLYETKETPVKVDDELDGIIFFSPSGVSSFFTANVLNDKTKLFAIGNTTADALKEKTSKEVFIADEVSAESMLRKVMSELV